MLGIGLLYSVGTRIEDVQTQPGRHRGYQERSRVSRQGERSVREARLPLLGEARRLLLCGRRQVGRLLRERNSQASSRSTTVRGKSGGSRVGREARSVCRINRAGRGGQGGSRRTTFNEKGIRRKAASWAG